MSKQIKSKDRVVDHGEVFTNEREVKAMVDLVWKNLVEKDADKPLTATFLEPSCGTGNFLIEILNRKISLLKETNYNFGLYMVLIAGSLYGIELLTDNVEECRERLMNCFKDNIPNSTDNYDDLMKSIEFIINNNIINGNTLEYSTLKGKPIEFVKWELGEGDIIKVSKHCFRSMTDGTGKFLAKFGPDPEEKQYFKLWELNF